MVLWYHRVADLPQAQLQIRSMIGRVKNERSRGYSTMLMGKLRRLQVRTAAGQILGYSPAMSIDAVRIERVVQRFVRGLFFHTRARRLEQSTQIVVQADPDKVREHQEDIYKLLHGPNLVSIQDGVFWYSYNVAADNPLVSLWLLVFFDEYAVLAFVREQTA